MQRTSRKGASCDKYSGPLSHVLCVASRKIESDKVLECSTAISAIDTQCNNLQPSNSALHNYPHQNRPHIDNRSQFPY
jgi:hypothetical protein